MTLEICLMRCLHVDVRKNKPRKTSGDVSVSISVIHKQYTSLHQAGAYNDVAYIGTESTKVNSWRKKGQASVNIIPGGGLVIVDEPNLIPRSRTAN